MNPGTSIDLNNKSYSKPYNKIDTKKFSEEIYIIKNMQVLNGLIRKLLS